MFTCVNFVRARAPISLFPMSLGVVYLVFLPSLVTTPLAGRVAGRIGTCPAIWSALAIAGTGLPLMLSAVLASLLAGLVLVGMGTFFAQATAPGFVGRAARGDRAAASGLCPASHCLGGLAGAWARGRIFDRSGWSACVAGVALALALAALLAQHLRVRA